MHKKTEIYEEMTKITLRNEEPCKDICLVEEAARSLSKYFRDSYKMNNNKENCGCILKSQRITSLREDIPSDSNCTWLKAANDTNGEYLCVTSIMSDDVKGNTRK